jgi:peroxygenase
VKVIWGQWVFGDVFGVLAICLEWLATWLLIWPDDGRLRKEDVRRVYDGSLFCEIAERRERSMKEESKRSMKKS